MGLSRLMAAVRHGNIERLKTLLETSPPDAVNDYCSVMPVFSIQHELPVYDSTPLFEAVRQRNSLVIDLLLAQKNIEVNKPCTKLNITPFCDVVMRGDVEVAARLLQDPRIDPQIGCEEFGRNTMVIAAKRGDIPILKLFGKHGLLTPEIEFELYDIAKSSNQTDALSFLQGFYIDSRELSVLTPGQQLVKIRREFEVIDEDGNGHCDRNELVSLLVSLGVDLDKELELEEAFMALDTSRDNRIDISQYAAFLVGPDVYAAAQRELDEAGSIAGFSISKS